jgi:hypothetical protein
MSVVLVGISKQEMTDPLPMHGLRQTVSWLWTRRTSRTWSLLCAPPRVAQLQTQDAMVQRASLVKHGPLLRLNLLRVTGMVWRQRTYGSRHMPNRL